MFERTIGQVAPRAVQYVTRPAEVLLLKYPQETSSFLLNTGHIITMLLPCCAAAAKAMPDRQLFEALSSHEEAEIAVLYYLSVFARVLLCCPQAVREIINVLLLKPELSGANFQGFDGSVGASGDKGMIILRMLLRLMLDTFDSVSLSSGGSWRRRLWALALISLYPNDIGDNNNSNRDSTRKDISDTVDSVSLVLRDVMPVDWFPEVVNIVDDVLCEEERENGNSGNLEHDEAHCIASDDDVDDTYCGDDEDEDGDGRWGVVKLYNDMLRRDIVSRAPLQRILKDKMHGIVSHIGDVAFNQGMMSSLGPTIMERISARS
jgi:hypothetical protein